MSHGTAVIPNRTAGLTEMPGVCAERSLMEMAASGLDGVPISAVVKMVKLAYCFEHWDVFDVLIEPTRAFIRVSMKQPNTCILIIHLAFSFNIDFEFSNLCKLTMHY